MPLFHVGGSGLFTLGPVRPWHPGAPCPGFVRGGAGAHRGVPRHPARGRADDAARPARDPDPGTRDLSRRCGDHHRGRGPRRPRWSAGSRPSSGHLHDRVRGRRKRAADLHGHRPPIRPTTGPRPLGGRCRTAVEDRRPGHRRDRGLREVGEICTRGYLVMARYLNAPEATARAITPDGWLRTGDLGSMDARGYCGSRAGSRR